MEWFGHHIVRTSPDLFPRHPFKLVPTQSCSNKIQGPLRTKIYAFGHAGSTPAFTGNKRLNDPRHFTLYPINIVKGAPPTGQNIL